MSDTAFQKKGIALIFESVISELRTDREIAARRVAMFEAKASGAAERERNRIEKLFHENAQYRARARGKS